MKRIESLRNILKFLLNLLSKFLIPILWFYKLLFNGLRKALDFVFEKIKSKKTHLLFYGFIASVLFDYSDIIIRLCISNISVANIPFGFLINSLAVLFLSITITSITKKEGLYIPIIGVLYGSIGYLNVIFLSPGIITVTWHGIIGFFIAMGFISDLFFNKITDNLKNAISKNDTEVALSLKEDIWSILKIMFQFTLAFIAITGVCMSILFGPDYNALEIKLNAIKMVSGFGLCMGIIFFWYFIPIINHFKEFREKGY